MEQTDDALARRLSDPARVAAVRATGLLDGPPAEHLDRLARAAATALRVPIAFVTVVDDERTHYLHGTPGVASRRTGDSFCQHVVGLDAELVIDDAPADPRVTGNSAIADLGVQAYAGFPLRSPDGHALGSLCAIDTTPRTWKPEELELLATLAEAASRDIALRAKADRAEALARTLQEALLPPVVPALPGFDVATAYRAAGSGDEVLGDFYDLVESAPGRWHVALGDVCGKGIAAARLTSLARHTIRAGVVRRGTPSEVLRLLNEALLLADDGGEDLPFVTCVLAMLEPVDGGVRMTWCSAGHVPVVVRDAGGVREELLPGSLLGVFEGAELADRELLLQPGDVVLLCTDGVTEARDAGHEQFGVERLLAAVGGAPQTAQGVVDALLAAVDAHAVDAAQDDIAVVALRLAS